MQKNVKEFYKILCYNSLGVDVSLTKGGLFCVSKEKINRECPNITY